MLCTTVINAREGGKMRKGSYLRTKSMRHSVGNTPSSLVWTLSEAEVIAALSNGFDDLGTKYIVAIIFGEVKFYQECQYIDFLYLNANGVGRNKRTVKAGVCGR